MTSYIAKLQQREKAKQQRQLKRQMRRARKQRRALEAIAASVDRVDNPFDRPIDDGIRIIGLNRHSDPYDWYCTTEYDLVFIFRTGTWVIQSHSKGKGVFGHSSSTWTDKNVLFWSLLRRIKPQDIARADRTPVYK